MLEARAEADLRSFHGALDAYARGDAAGAIEVVLAWPPDRFARVLRLADRPRDPFRPWGPGRYALAVMLLTDIALGSMPSEGGRIPLPYLTIASRLLAAGSRELPDVRRWASRWYFTVSRIFRARNDPAGAETLLALARDRLPTDPIVLFESATLAELMATHYIAAGVQARLTYQAYRPIIPIAELQKRRTGRLIDAARWLREAAVLDPQNDLLRVHLGRVLALQQEDDAALRTLEPIARDTTDDATAYLAWLFIGGVRERQEKLEAAAAAYAAAIARFPQGQAAYIGSSEALQRAGKGDEAREVLQRRFVGGEDVREPLWAYLFDVVDAADQRLDALRHEVRQ